MLYKRKAITKTIKLIRVSREPKSPFCDSYKCLIMMHNQRGDGGVNCIDLCYRLSDYNSTYEQYIKHRLRYIGM